MSNPTVTATTVEDDSAIAQEYVRQDLAAPDATDYIWTVCVAKDAVAPATRFLGFIPVVDAAYPVNLDTSTGNSIEVAGLGGSHTVTSDVVDNIPCWRVELAFTTDDDNGIQLFIQPARGANADLTTPGNAAVGTITILRQQLQLGGAFTTYQLKNLALNYNWLEPCGGGDCSNANTNTRTLVVDGSGLRFQYTTDDYDSVALSDAATVSYLAVLEVDDCAANRAILSKGGYDQWYLDTSCKPVFASTSGSVTATNALTAGKTYVVGVTVTGTSVAHWLSGTANGTGTLTTRTTGADSDLLVGKLSGGSYFEGYIDLIAVDDSAIKHSRAYTSIHDNYESERGLTVE